VVREKIPRSSMKGAQAELEQRKPTEKKKFRTGWEGKRRTDKRTRSAVRGKKKTRCSKGCRIQGCFAEWGLSMLQVSDRTRGKRGGTIFQKPSKEKEKKKIPI